MTHTARVAYVELLICSTWPGNAMSRHDMREHLEEILRAVELETIERCAKMFEDVGDFFTASHVRALIEPEGT